MGWVTVGRGVGLGLGTVVKVGVGEEVDVAVGKVSDGEGVGVDVEVKVEVGVGIGVSVGISFTGSVVAVARANVADCSFKSTHTFQDRPMRRVTMRVTATTLNKFDFDILPPFCLFSQAFQRRIKFSKSLITGF